MIARVFRGHSTYGLVKYLFGEGRRNEHVRPHLCGSWDGDPTALEPAVLPGAGSPAIAALVRQLEQPVTVCDRAPAQWVYHLVLRTDAADRELSDAEWERVCTAAMSEVGIAPYGDPSGCRWVAVRHAADHVHVVATLAREDGRPPRIWRDYRTLGVVVERFEAEFGLRSTAGFRDKTAAPRPGVRERAAAEHAGRQVPARVVLRRQVQAALAGTSTFAEFAAHLRARNITIRPRMSTTNPDVMTGYSVALEGWTTAAGQPIWFGGGKLAPDLSLPRVTARWDATRHRTDVSAIPRIDEGMDAVRLSVPTHRHPSTRSAATNAEASADLMMAAALTIDPTYRGPLVTAADLYAHAARQTMISPRPSRQTRLDSSHRQALHALARHRPTRQADLILAMIRLAQSLAALRQQQHRHRHADFARDAEHLICAARRVALHDGSSSLHASAARPSLKALRR